MAPSADARMHPAMMQQQFQFAQMQQMMEWGMKLESTSRSQFIPHYGVVKREAIRPKRTIQDPSTFDTRSTTQDSYVPFPSSYRPSQPIYPPERPRDKSKFEHTSTSRAAYVQHAYIPYVQAVRPSPSMGREGVGSDTWA